MDTTASPTPSLTPSSLQTPPSSKKKALMIAPFAFMPDWEGSRKRIRQMLSVLDKAGYEVHYLLVQLYDADTQAMARLLTGSLTVLPNEAGENLGQAWYRQTRFAKYTSWLTGWYHLYNFHHDGWYFPKVGETVQQLVSMHGIELVMCEYVFYSKALEQLNNVVKVIDTHDVFADRYKAFLESGRRPAWYSTSAKGEKTALARADIVLAIQEDDSAALKQYGLKQVLCVPYVPAAVPTDDTAQTDTLELCFVGSGNDFNFSALEAFFVRVAPALQAAGVRYRLSVFGKVCGRFADSSYARDDTVRWGGIADDLKVALGSCDALVNPLAAGTGLPIKVLDSLAHGLHVLGSEAGLRGLNGVVELKAMHVCDEPAEWVQKCTALLHRKASGDNLRADARADHLTLWTNCLTAERHFIDAVDAVRASRISDLSAASSLKVA